ncbi:MAG: hypothetical protein ABI906_07880 [Pseudomonadota bacterium]
MAEANMQGVIAGLPRIAKAGEALSSAAGVKEARLTMLEIARLARDRADNRHPPRSW